MKDFHLCDFETLSLEMLRYSGAPGTSHVSTAAAATIVLSIDESAKTILRDVERSENLGGRAVTWGPKKMGGGRE